MAEFAYVMTPAERQRLLSQVRLLLEQPQLSDHQDYCDVETTLKYRAVRPNGLKRRRKHTAQQASSLEYQANGLDLVCELVMAKGRDKLRARSLGNRFAALIVSKGPEGSHHFSVAIVDCSSKNLDVVLGDEAEVIIVGIDPVVFMSSLREVTDNGATVRNSRVNAEIHDVPSIRRPRSRAATSVWNLRNMMTLKGCFQRMLVLMALYVCCRRLEFGWNEIDSMTHYYHGRMPPSLWNSPAIQTTFEIAKSLQRFEGFDLDAVTYQAVFSRRQFVVGIVTAFAVHIPKLCLSAYVVVTLVFRGGTGPFYRTLCFEAVYLAWDEYMLLASTQMMSVIFSKTSYASFSGDMLLEAARVFYLCLLCWNPADRTHRLRFLVRCLTISIFTSILLMAIVWSPFFLKTNEPQVVDLEEFAKRFQLPELRPSDKRNIPFLTS